MESADSRTPLPGSTAFAALIRRHALSMVSEANASHIGSALSIADIIAVLYAEILHLDPGQPAFPGRDRFLLSKGHACVAVYAALAVRGFFPPSELANYGRDHSPLMNHISHKVAGVEFSTGALGHGLPFGVGKALAAKRQKANWRTFVVLGDGEMDEGSNWEALMFASHHCLDNLVAIIDYNNLQSLTTVAQTLGLEPLRAKLESFGWSVQEVDGHDHEQLRFALNCVPWQAGRPSVLIARTVKGKGVSFMEDKVEWHYRSPNKSQLIQALAELEASGA